MYSQKVAFQDGAQLVSCPLLEVLYDVLPGTKRGKVQDYRVNEVEKF